MSAKSAADRDEKRAAHQVGSCLLGSGLGRVRLERHTVLPCEGAALSYAWSVLRWPQTSVVRMPLLTMTYSAFPTLQAKATDRYKSVTGVKAYVWQGGVGTPAASLCSAHRRRLCSTPLCSALLCSALPCSALLACLLPANTRSISLAITPHSYVQRNPCADAHEKALECTTKRAHLDKSYVQHKCGPLYGE